MSDSSPGATPFFSIVTPSYNQGEFIHHAVESVIGQRRSSPPLDIEYLIRDNLSTDLTTNVLASYEGQFRLLREKDAGQVDAINKGFRETRGQWFAWLNADDFYEPGALAAVREAAVANPNARWIVGQFRIVNGVGNPVGKTHSLYKNKLLSRYSYNLLLSENIIPQMSVFIRRDLFEQAGMLLAGDPLAFDYEYWLRLGKICDPLVLNRNLSVFRYHAQSKTANGLKDQFARELAYAKQYAGSAKWPIWLHRINYYKTIWFYDLVKKF
jgi:glycosyltransferase involved in cell wall biosynthesis